MEREPTQTKWIGLLANMDCKKSLDFKTAFNAVHTTAMGARFLDGFSILGRPVCLDNDIVIVFFNYFTICPNPCVNKAKPAKL
jgi:hypothetical protein